jgi:hypothetical protein
MARACPIVAGVAHSCLASVRVDEREHRGVPPVMPEPSGQFRSDGTPRL